MGKPLMLQQADDDRIEQLRERLSIPRKVDVVRAGLDLLQAAAERRDRSDRWRLAAKRSAASSRRVNAEFRRHSRLIRG